MCIIHASPTVARTQGQACTGSAFDKLGGLEIRRAARLDHEDAERLARDRHAYHRSTLLLLKKCVVPAAIETMVPSL